MQCTESTTLIATGFIFKLYNKINMGVSERGLCMYRYLCNSQKTLLKSWHFDLYFFFSPDNFILIFFSFRLIISCMTCNEDKYLKNGGLVSDDNDSMYGCRPRSDETIMSHLYMISHEIQCMTVSWECLVPMVTIII